MNIYLHTLTDYVLARQRTQRQWRMRTLSGAHYNEVLHNDIEKKIDGYFVLVVIQNKYLQSIILVCCQISDQMF